MSEYFEANRLNWNDRAEIHARSVNYNLQRYVDDPVALSGVVAFDQQFVGDLAGKTAVHLQCHIGTDTLSLARLGAEMCAIDQSENSLATARQLFDATGTNGHFELCNMYDAAAVLGRQFDLVYTGVGAINWLPDIERWARVVADLLVPGGQLYIREGHPMLWALDDERTDSVLSVRYPYFETTEPMAFDFDDTYTDGDDKVASTRSYEWNHGIGEIVMALLENGLELTLLKEHRELEWKALPQMVKADGGRYCMPDDQADKVPLMYSLMATRRPNT